MTQVLRTAESSAPALEAVSIHKRFASFHAVRGIDLAVRRGEFLTLLGPSGCGKTTLMRIMAGFESPSEGRILISGEDMTNRPPYRRPLGMMFQGLALFPHLSVGDNVAFGLRVRRLSRAAIAEQVREALDLVGLPHLAERGIHQISGGQRQRVALARALAVKPSVLLLDEPLSALDLKLRRQMQEELKRIQQRLHTTFVFVTHDQEEALGMSDRIAVMNHGVVEQVGTAKEIYDRPRSLFVAQFVGETNVFSAERDSDGSLRLTQFHRSCRIAAPPGRHLAVVVRPEAIELHAASAPEAARITAETYLGASVRYRVEGADGLVIHATLPCRVGEAPPFACGARVTIDWPAERAVAVPLDPGVNTEASHG